ncbi:unnamed protein product [Chondrus crispus]|uniref:Uncharacterized protein n=1 Tax=Chondrus crispus TaxID=2769 RepID=R7QIX2_CHOCR|nr:unnamed protein product [Chondrus crispus]CDF38004.1 unnamed protein product [Chondrus crispus]|eukprot:XP_005717873.1 unnamed protein product [Chondrus crispus]
MRCEEERDLCRLRLGRQLTSGLPKESTSQTPSIPFSLVLCVCVRDVRPERKLRLSLPERAQKRERNGGDRARRSERPQSHRGPSLLSA